MNRGWFFFLSTLLSVLFSLPAQEGVVTLILEPDEAYSGRVRFSLAGWEILGAVSWREDGQEFKPENLLLRGPWGGVGGIVPRGILKELETPSLSRVPQPPGQRGPVFDTSFIGSPRRGIILGPAGGPGGVSVWSFQDRQTGGFWYEKYRNSCSSSWGTGFLLREGGSKEATGWLKEEPLLLSPWFASAGWWGRFESSWMNAGTGIFCSAAPVDPPGIWIRLWGEFRVASLNLLFFGGASSPRVWDSDGTRMAEQASYNFSASWKPWKPLTLDIRFSETQEHPGYLFHPYRRHRSEGEGSFVFAVSSGELRARFSRSIKRDERGDAVLRDFIQLQGILKPGAFRLMGEVSRHGGMEDRVAFSGTVGYERDRYKLALQAILEREGALWQRDVGLKASCGTEKLQLQLHAGLHRPDGEGWHAAGKFSFQWKFSGE